MIRFPPVGLVLGLEAHTLCFIVLPYQFTAWITAENYSNPKPILERSPSLLYGCIEMVTIRGCDTVEREREKEREREREQDEE